MTYEFARAQDLEAIRKLLKACELPFDDLDAHLDHFIVAKDQSRVVGCIGFERNGPLLRSLAVDPDSRSSGIARELCARLLDHAKQQGVRKIYLLTNTAEEFFNKAGFQRMNREESPENIRKHRQFTELCPSSAALMWKEL